MKTNYYLHSVNEINKIKNFKKKPKLLIHACCAPCACYPLTFLNDVFDCTIIYNNSNIYPKEEYLRRINELRNYLTHLSTTIQLIELTYNNEEYNQILKVYANEPEKGKRCHLCYRTRIKEGFEYASQHGFDYYTTVMTISRQKDSQVLNEIAKELEMNYPTVQYFYSDFKKSDGILKANEIIKEYNMYRQDYCGCIYSFLKNNSI